MSAHPSNYAYDVFVSYARVDNNPVLGIDAGWVSHLTDTLENVFAQLLGRSDRLRLWTDFRRKDDVHLTSDILNVVKQSATFLVILSPGYLASPWCQDELKSFLGSPPSPANGQLRRVFVAEKTMYNVERPSELAEVISYAFWYKDEKNRYRTRGLPKFLPEEIEYYHLIEDIAVDMDERLKALN